MRVQISSTGIQTIRRSQTVETKAQQPVEQLQFTEIQAQAILECSCAAWRVERKKLQEEYNDLKKLIAYWKTCWRTRRRSWA